MQNKSMDNTSLAIKLIDVALKDFEASKTLFEKNLYPQAIFMFQQSLEKTIKAVLLKLNIVYPDELDKKIGHYIIENAYEIAMCRLATQLFAPSSIKFESSREIQINSTLAIDTNTIIKALIMSQNMPIIVLHTISSMGQFIAELTKFYKNVKHDQRFRKILLSSIDSLDYETKENIERIKSYLCSLNTLLQHAFSSSALTIQAKEYIKNYVNTVMLLSSPDMRKTLLDRYSNSIENAVLRGISLIYLHIIIFWYIFLEPYVSKVRYPNENWSPLDINENTVIAYLCREALKCIEKNSILKCLKEFITNEKLSSQECLELVIPIRKFFDIIS